MQLKTKLPKLQILTILFLLMVGSLLLLPEQTVDAQSCRPGEPVHVIADGENLYRIGLRYGVPFEAIAFRNGITDATSIFTGMTICIPVGGTPPTTTNTTSVNTTTPVNTTTSAAPGHENWCSNGGPWDDGRCIVPNDLALQSYWFFAGWCNAQVQLGNRSGSVDDCLNGVTGQNANLNTTGTTTTTTTTTTGIASVTTLDYGLVDLDDDEFACTVVYDKDTGTVVSLAEWDDDYDDQTQLIFFSNLPNLTAYAVDLDDDDERGGIITVTDPYKTLRRAEASIKSREDDDDDRMTPVGPVDCELITT